MLSEMIYASSRDFPLLSAKARSEICFAAADTFAVLAAGWNEPATQGVRAAYPAVQPPGDGDNSYGAEACALVWGTAAHALDFDDVHMTSVTHPSAVLVAALEAMVQSRPALAPRRAEAFTLGLAVNMALGEALGFDHYARGWHATSTIGSVACGAAVAHLLDMDRPAFASALAIAAAQSSGLQRNFGTTVKPLQAGLAAAAGVRAGLLAEAGMRGPEDIFGGSNGFLTVFGQQPAVLPKLDIEKAVTTLSRKLFGCCYLAHRPVSAALDLRERVDVAALSAPGLQIDVTVPPGCLKALTVAVPMTGLEAKFSGQYTVAHALLHGGLGLKAFTDEAVRDSHVINLARRVSLREVGPVGSGTVGIDRGEVEISARLNGTLLGQATAVHYPGSPGQPMSQAQLDAKILDCVGGDAAKAEQVLNRARMFAGVPS